MLFGLKKPTVKSRPRAIGDITFLFIIPLLMITGILYEMHGGGNVSNEKADQWIEDILFAVIIVFPYGLYKAYWAVIAIIRNDYSSDSETVICLNCYEMFSVYKVNKMVCPRCTGTLENLNGFYDRHPDLKDKAPKNVHEPGKEERNAR